LDFVSKVGDKKALDMLYVLTYADVNAVAENVYSSFNADLMKELYRNALTMIDKKELVGEAVKRKRREKLLDGNERFSALPPALKKKVHAIQSNLFFIKFKSDVIVDIIAMAQTEDEYTFRIENERRFILHLVTKKEFHLGWFLSRFIHIDLVSMDIFKLFDRAKYFRIEFHTVLEEDSESVRALIESAFDMSRQLDYPKPEIKAGDITFDIDHSLTYAKMLLRTKNQKGLMATVIDIFDRLGIDIATAKVSTAKNIANDLFLIEKSALFRDNYKKIVPMLTKK